MRKLIFLLISFCLTIALNAQNFNSPYPIIFVHGWGGEDASWDKVNTEFFYGAGEIYDVCLNHDGDLSSANIDADVYPIGFRDRDSELSPKGIYIVNFNEDNFSESGHEKHKLSNESAIYKHGKALHYAIKDVLELEHKFGKNAEKVILVGHSMGGLSIREYLQRTEDGTMFSDPKWWIDPKSSDGHKVAKVVTLGTPHGGSNFMPNWFDELLIPVPGYIIQQIADLDIKSEAVRDLRTSYGMFDIDVEGKYLYGGRESGPPSNFYNSDINCDGDEDDYIIRLNSNETDAVLDNPNMPLPENIYYTWVTSQWSWLWSYVSLGGDGVVKLKNQWLNKGGDSYPFGISDTILMDSWHIAEPKDVFTVIRSLDEPDKTDFAYKILINKKYSGFPSIKPDEMQLSKSMDVDYFYFEANNNGVYKVDLNNILENDFISASVLDENQNYISTIRNINEDLLFFVKNDSKYYLKLVLWGHRNNWHSNYHFSINSYSKEAVQVALSIDRSGSMGWDGYMELAKKASIDFVDLMEFGDFLAVTSFHHYGSVNYPFSELKTLQDRTDVKDSINTLYASGGTSIGEGMRVAQMELNKGNTDLPQGMILMSDGYTASIDYANQILSTIPGNTDIYTISLGNNSDENLLNRIAAETGGIYSYAPTTDRLSLIYNTIKSKVSGQQTVALKSGQIALEETLEHQVYIDQGAVLFEGVITWPGSDLDLEIIDPLGNVIGHNSNLPNVTFREGPTFEKYRILNPIPGLYTFRITGVDISGLTEPYTLSITTESTLEMNVEFDKEAYGIDDPILVSANIDDGGTPVTGAIVSAKVTSPSSLLTKSASADELTKKEIHDLKDQGIYEEESISLKSASIAETLVESDLILYDDGLHGDGAANDGIYANYFSETSVVGSYIFDVTATGTAPSSGEFSRFESKSTVVTDQKTIVVSEPQAGTVWSVGSHNVVKWSSTNIDGNVNIYLSIDGGSTYPIELAMATPDDGEQLIKLPATPSTTCRVKVESINYPSIVGFNSGNFTLECDETPSILTYVGETTVQYSDEIALSAQLTDELSGVGIEEEEILFTIGTQTAKATTDADGIASTTLTLTQDPCIMDAWEIQMDFTGSCANAATTNTEALDYMPEQAHIEYTGTTISATESVKSYDFTVTLRAIIWDDMDDYPGNISNAHARFVIGGEPIVTGDTDDDGFIPVKLLMDGDESIGMIETDWASTLKDNPTTFDVKVELMNCYYKGMSFDNPLTVYNSVGDFITGGGHLAINSSADGAYAPMTDSKLNFGYNVRINKNGKNLIGKMNIVYRRMEADGLHTYQIKSNATTSLGTNVIDESTQIAEFVSKANLTDVTVLDEYGNGVEVAGNLTLHVTMTDKGEPGDMDQIAFSLYNSDIADPNALWFSNNWDGTNTLEQLLDGGNLVIHSSAILGDDSEETAENPKNKNKSAFITSDNYELKVYPNPFSDKVYFEFTSMTDTNARLELFDASGKKLIVLFDKDIKAKQINTVDYSPDNISTQMLFYRIIFDNEVINGKINYRK